MPTIQQQINQLKKDKETLNTMLNMMGVETTGNETFTQLTPLVGKIVTDPILQDKTIEITENGTTNIVADEGYNGLNNVEVVTNVEAGVQNEINLFIQEEEPEKKEGLWLQTSNNNIPKKLTITSKGLDVSLGAWNEISNYEQLPYDFYLGSTVVIDTDIYIFFNETISGVNATYKYDTINNTYTRLTDVPFNSNRSTASAIGTDIYIFGSSVSPYNIAYKYDTITDTFTQIANGPYNLYNASSVAYNNSIYLFGGSDSTYNACRYDVDTDTYTSLANMPLDLSAGRVTIVGNTVYMFGLGGSYLQMLKYNIETDTYTRLGQLYSAARCLLVPINNYIYIFGSSYTDAVGIYCYQFDTTNNSTTRLNNLPFTFGQGGGGLVGDKIYLIGSKFTGNTKRVQTVNINRPIFNDNTILLMSTTSNQYSTKLINDIESEFENCYIYFKNSGIIDDDISTYYGDGTQWIKFKN